MSTTSSLEVHCRITSQGSDFNATIYRLTPQLGAFLVASADSLGTLAKVPNNQKNTWQTANQYPLSIYLQAQEG